MHRKIKWSKILLALVFAGIFGSLIVSDIFLRKDYDRIDKSDVYWTFREIFSEPYSHLKINGGNLSMIAYTPSPHPSVRVLKNWEAYKDGAVKTSVRNDTLFIDFPKAPANFFDRDQMASQTSLRLFGPTLRSVSAENTNLLLEKFDGRDMNLTLRGKSKFEIETIHRDMGNLVMNMSDSSQTEVELSPDIPGNRELRVASMTARLDGSCLLLMGHAKIDSLELNINALSAFQSSGATWNRRLKK